MKAITRTAKSKPTPSPTQRNRTMTNVQKQQIVAAIEREIESLGSAAKVANKCDLNQAYISMMRNPNQWGNGTLKESHWSQVATALNVKATGWKVVETMNTKIVVQVLEDAKDNSLFMAISHNAGSGKTASAREFATAYKSENVFYYHVPHGETNKADFIRSLGTALGLDMSRGIYTSANGLADYIIQFFTKRLDTRPLLIVDEADKLTDKALKFFIALYNAVEGRMGCVILGTENLQRTIKSGVRGARNGFDEIDSRFGRRYITLQGVTKQEAFKICSANGLTDKTLQARIFEESEPVTTMIGGTSIKVLMDLRPLVRKVQRELLNLQDVETMEASAV